MSSDPTTTGNSPESASPPVAGVAGLGGANPEPRPQQAPVIGSVGRVGRVRPRGLSPFEPSQVFAKCAIVSLGLLMLASLLSAGSTVLAMATLRRIVSFNEKRDETAVQCDEAAEQRDEVAKQRDEAAKQQKEALMPETPNKRAAVPSLAGPNTFEEADKRFLEAENRHKEAEKRLKEAEKKVREAEKHRLGARGELLDEWQSAWRRERLAYFVNACTVLAAAAGFIAWFHRAYGSLPALQKRLTERSPGWAIGGWFVPVLNLAVPYRIMTEIWRASDPGAATSGALRGNARLPVVGLWWALVLIWGLGGVGFALAVLLAGNPWNAENPKFATLWLAVLTGLASLPAGLVSIWIVRAVNSGQEAKFLAQRQPKAAAQP